MGKNMEPLMSQIEIRVNDPDRGDIVIEKQGPGRYMIWCQILDLGGSVWEPGIEPEKSLQAAVLSVAEILKQNVENDFYEGWEK